MSRIGQKPVTVPDGVKVSLRERELTVEGKLGKLNYTHRPEIKVAVNEDSKEVVCTRESDERTVRAYHGLTRSLIQNMVGGVSSGYEKRLEIHGVGYVGAVQEGRIELRVCFANEIWCAIIINYFFSKLDKFCLRLA